MKRFYALILFCYGLQSCGVSTKELTDPSKKDRDKAEQLRRDNEEREKQAQATEALYSSLAFNLQDETDACARSKDGADFFKVELVSCTLEKDALTVSASDPEAALTHTETFKFEISDEELKSRVSSIESQRLLQFFTAMAGVVAYSKKKASD